MNNNHTTRFRPGPICAMVIFAALSWMNTELIADCMISLAGSLALAALHPGRMADMVLSGVVEYWIAGAAWCSTPVFIAMTIISTARPGLPPLRRRGCPSPGR